MKKFILLLTLMVINFGFSQTTININQGTGLIVQDNYRYNQNITLPSSVLNSVAPPSGYVINFSWGANNGNHVMRPGGGPYTPSARFDIVVNGIKVWEAISPPDCNTESGQNSLYNGASSVSGTSGNWAMQAYASLNNTETIRLPLQISKIQNIYIEGSTGSGGEGGDDFIVQINNITVGKATCLAGTSAPSLSSTSISNICPATTANLTSITASNIPVETTISYHTSATASSANKVTNPSSVASGTYYLAFEDSVNNCYSPTTAVVVTINPCLTDTDTDGDGIPDINDVDDDNDGILDTQEGFCSSQSVYTLNVASTLAGATIGANGGSFNLIYTLTSGVAVPSIGNSFTVPFAYSDFNNTVNAQNHIWSAFATSATEFKILPNTTSLYTGLPTNNNSTSENPSGASPNTFDGQMYHLLNTGRIDKLGTFTTTIGNLPAVSGTYSYSSNTVLNLVPDMNAAGGGAGFASGYYAKMQLQNTLNPVNSSRGLPYAASYGNTYTWDYTAFSSTAGSGALNAGRGLITILQNTVTFCNSTDTDRDGIPNHLDLDSDNDGCLDAIEGGSAITTSQLVNAGGTASVGTGSSAPNQNLCGGSACVSTSGANIGLPQLALPLPTGYSNVTGQSIGDSQNASVSSQCGLSYCYKPAATSGTVLDTNHGITALGRAGSGDADNWPMVRKGAWTVLEAKTKGFVPNRVPFDGSGNPVGIVSSNFVEGMMVYDTTNNCLKIYDGTAWKCYTTQACPD